MTNSVHWLSVKSLLTCLIALSLLFLAETAHAFYLPLLFEPPAPVAGQLAQVRVRVGECDAVQVFNPQQREIAVVGNTVRVTINGSTAFDQTFCIYPDVSVLLDLVPLAAGTYRVEVYRRQISSPLVVDLMQSADLIVGIAPPVSVPSLGLVSASALAFAIFIFGLVRTRHSLS